MLRRLTALAGRLETSVIDRVAAKDVAIFCKQVLWRALQSLHPTSTKSGSFTSVARCEHYTP